jgi:hypothetical protein
MIHSVPQIARDERIWCLDEIKFLHANEQSVKVWPSHTPNVITVLPGEV